MFPVTVIVLTWNGLDYTRVCLSSLCAMTDLSQVRVVVVDNGSSDGTTEYLRSLDWITPVFNDSNLGFVRGNNIALRRLPAGHDAVLLNNDTEIIDPEWLPKLQRTAYGTGADHGAKPVGIVGCRLRRTGTRMLQHAGTYMPDFTYWGQQIGGGEHDINQYNQDRDVEGVVFACAYITRRCLDDVGLLDEDYFSYFEDTDYCLKARASGFRVVNCGTLTTLHREHASVDVNRVSHNDMFLASQKIFLSKWKEYLDERLDVSLNWYSTFSSPLGYATASRSIVKGLESVGVAVSYAYLYGPGSVYPVPEERNLNTGDYQIETIKRRALVDSAPTVAFGQADAFDRAPGAYRIGWTMLETTGVPSEWVRQCNSLDELWVPSTFNAWTFRRSGVTVPVHVMPLGLIDTDHFNPQIDDFKIDGTYTFLSIFEWGERKAPDVLLRAFNRAFRSSDPVVLLCKYTNRDPSVDPEALVAEMGLDPDGGAVVFSANENLPYHQLAALYRSADCFVLPTRGEGWGMPVLEAMACGLPVIASHWSAQQSFMTDANSYPLQVSLVQAEAKCPYYRGFNWAEPSEAHLVSLLRRAYENREEAAQKGARAAADVQAHWSIRQSARKVRQRISTVLGDCERGPDTPVTGGCMVERHREKIAIDVSRAFGEEVTGVGRYTLGLLAGLHLIGLEQNCYEYLLLPGFDGFVHPRYLSPFDFVAPSDDRFTVYRGPLPAFGDADRYVPGVDLTHCTANAWPRTLDMPSALVVYDLTFITHARYHTKENVELCSDAFARAAQSDCAFVAISNHTRNDLIEQYKINPERITVAYPAIDTTRYRPCEPAAVQAVREKYQLPSSFILFVGSIEPRKNLATLITAMSMVKTCQTLVVAGAAGWHNTAIAALIRGSKVDIRMLGYVPESDLPSLYTAASATVYPSLYEGFGYPVIESMACGTPVITSDNSSLSEIGAGAALLIGNPRDAREIASAIDQVLGDSSLRDELVRQGHLRASQFTPEACAFATLKVYERLLH